MAFQKVKSSAFGVSGNYWRIVQLNCNYDRADAVCTVALYLDTASRLAGSAPLSVVQVDLANDYQGATTDATAEAMKNVSLKEAYKSIKRLAANPEADEDLRFFSDAEDV